MAAKKAKRFQSGREVLEYYIDGFRDTNRREKRDDWIEGNVECGARAQRALEVLRRTAGVRKRKSC